MAETMAPAVTKFIWIDLASSDPTASRLFYARLFGWQVEVNPDPQYGGYALAKIGARTWPELAEDDARGADGMVALRLDVQRRGAGKEGSDRGGTVIVPPMQVGEQGKMAVFQDPSGAFISAWQPAMMEGGLTDGQPGSFGWRSSTHEDSTRRSLLRRRVRLED